MQLLRQVFDVAEQRLFALAQALFGVGACRRFAFRFCELLLNLLQLGCTVSLRALRGGEVRFGFGGTLGGIGPYDRQLLLEIRTMRLRLFEYRCRCAITRHLGLQTRVFALQCSEFVAHGGELVCVRLPQLQQLCAGLLRLLTQLCQLFFARVDLLACLRGCGLFTLQRFTRCRLGGGQLRRERLDLLLRLGNRLAFAFGIVALRLLGGA